MDQLLLLYEVSKKQGYLKLGLQLQINAIQIDDVVKLFQTQQSSILSQNLEKDLEDIEVAPFVFLVLIQFKDRDLPIYMQQCLAQTVVVGAVGIQQDGAPKPAALAEYVLLSNKVDINILEQVQSALVRRTFDTSGLVFQLIWLKKPETDPSSQNLLFHQLKSFLVANAPTTNLHKILINAAIEALGDPMYKYIEDIIQAFPLQENHKNENKVDTPSQNSLLSWRDAIILTQIYDGPDSYQLLTKLSSVKQKIPHNILLVLLTAANLLPQLQLCVNNVSNKSHNNEQNEQQQNDMNDNQEINDSDTLQLLLKHENYYNKANQLIIQRVGERMTYYDDQYASMLIKHLEVFYLPFLVKNNGIFDFQLSNIINQTKTQYVQNQQEYHIKLLRQYKFTLLTGLEQTLGVLPNVFMQIYDVIAFNTLCKTISSVQKELNQVLQRDKKQEKHLFPLLYTFGLLNPSIVIRERCKSLLQLEDVLAEIVAMNAEVPNWPSAEMLYEDFQFRNVAVCRNFVKYEEILLQKYSKNINDFIIDIFDVENEYISQLVDFATSQEFYDSVQFFLFNLIINDDIKDQKTKNYVRAVLTQLLCGYYGEFKMSFFQIANQTVVTTILQYLLLSIDPHIQLTSSFLYLILTSTNNSAAVFKELFKKGESGILITQILYKEHLQFISGIESRYMTDLKAQPGLSLLTREHREFGKRCCEALNSKLKEEDKYEQQVDLKYQPFNVFKIVPDDIEWSLPLLTILDMNGTIQLIAENNGFKQDDLLLSALRPNDEGERQNKLLNYILGGNSVKTEAELFKKQLVEISFHKALNCLGESNKDINTLNIIKAIFEKYNHQYILKNQKLTVQTIKDLILYQDLLTSVQLLKIHDINETSQNITKLTQKVSNQCELSLSIRNGILSLINIFSQDSNSQLYTQCLGLYLDNLYKYCNLIKQDQITNNLLQVISILMDKLLQNAHTQVSLQQVNKIISSMNYFDRIIKNSTYNNIKFDKLLDFYILNTNKLNIPNDIIINFMELITNMINAKFVFTIEQITKLIQYLYTKYDNMQNKMFINPLYNFLISLEKNMLQTIYSSLQIRKNILIGAYILLQELYLQLSENYEEEKVASVALQYQDIYLMILSQDMQHILNNQFVRSRANTPNVHFTQVFNLALQKAPNTENLNKFLSITKCGAVFMVDFLQEYQIMDQIILNVTDEQGLDNLHKIFVSGGTMPVESYEQMFQKLLDLDFQTYQNNVQYYDFMYKLSLKLFNQEQYENNSHIKYNNILTRQKDMIDFYQKTRNCRIQTLILLILSQLINKQSVEMMIKLAVQIAKQLDYEATSADKLQLCFMCHVKNVMQHSDHRASQVLPAAYFKYIKEIKNQV